MIADQFSEQAGACRSAVGSATIWPRSRFRKPWVIGGAGLLFALALIAVVKTFFTGAQSSLPLAPYLKNSAAETLSTALPQRTQSIAGVSRMDSIAKARSEAVNAPSAPGTYVHNASESSPMVARAAGLSILVKDFARAHISLESVLAKHRGYAANLSVETPENAQRQFHASLRIPSNELSASLNELKLLGRTLNESQSGEEVTRQHADLVARLQNSRETEQRLRSVLEHRTGKIDDVLQVEEEIARVRGEIESMEAEQKALEHRVEFASVELQLVEEYQEHLGPAPISASGRLHNGFVQGMRNASESVLGLILFAEEYGPAIVIWAVILGLPTYFTWRRCQKARARS